MGQHKEKILVHVLGPHKTRPGDWDIIDMIERVPRGVCLPQVTYKGESYVVYGGRGRERICVGFQDTQVDAELLPPLTR